MQTTKKLGRPTNNPKIARVQAKLDEDTRAILTMYCEEKKVTESEAIRRGIRKLGEDLGEEE